MKTRLVPPVSPAEMLTEEFLKPLRMSIALLARELHMAVAAVDDIATGRGNITAETDLRLCRFFGLSEGWWSRLQIKHDIIKSKRELGEELAKIKPLNKR